MEEEEEEEEGSESETLLSPFPRARNPGNLGMRDHEIMELCSRSSMDFLSLFLRDKAELELIRLNSLLNFIFKLD